MMSLISKLKLSLNPKSWKLWVMIIIIAAGITFFYLIQLPSKGSVKILTPSDLTQPKIEDSSLWDKARQQFADKAIKQEDEEAGRVGLGTYRGKYISFQYPNSYELKTKESSSSGILEKVILLGSGISPRKVAVTATKMTNADSLNDVSAIQVRRLKPKTYLEKPLDVSDKKGILFEKKGEQFEKTAFILKDQLLVTLALTSVNKDSVLDTDFDFILKELTLL